MPKQEVIAEQEVSSDNRPESEPLLLPRRAAAWTLGISVRTLDSLISAKQIQVRRIGRRVLVARRTLQKFANTR